MYLRKRLINSTSRKHNLLCKSGGNKPDSGKMNWRYSQGNNTRRRLLFMRLPRDRDREGQGREFIRGVHETRHRKADEANSNVQITSEIVNTYKHEQHVQGEDT